MNFPLPLADLKALAAQYPTPFYLYDELAIRTTARAITQAFSLFPHFFEHFAVKALPNPVILKILHSEGFGVDCSSSAELFLADIAGIHGEQIMFSSNQTPLYDYQQALARGAIINIDDESHIDFLEKNAYIPSLLSCRYNPGNIKEGNAIIGKPEEAKFGCTREHIMHSFTVLRDKGVSRFALHTMVASNELNIQYHRETAHIIFELARDIQEKTGICVEFVNLGGGVGIPYRPEQKPVDLCQLAHSIRDVYDDILVPAGLNDVGIHIEWGRAVTGPHGWLVTNAIHHKNIYRKYIGLNACMADLMRPGLYGAYHHITVAGKELSPQTEIYDVVGGLCENNDKFAIQRPLPKIEAGDFIIIHDVGAHGRAMGFNYNGKLRCGELLLRPDGSILQIRRPETFADYSATLNCDAVSLI